MKTMNSGWITKMITLEVSSSLHKINLNGFPKSFIHSSNIVWCFLAFVPQYVDLHILIEILRTLILACDAPKTTIRCGYDNLI